MTSLTRADWVALLFSTFTFHPVSTCRRRQQLLGQIIRSESTPSGCFRMFRTSLAQLPVEHPLIHPVVVRSYQALTTGARRRSSNGLPRLLNKRGKLGRTPRLRGGQTKRSRS
ncbi:hypothetical protein DB88DRAFT_498708 [Papiliotrema laurentii]|uniref:Secreted protein n=1 Tax=Papiliotrema laurentii TaxID=5418 RepID=A0AAD9FQ45_PAPLA|nr:hypothetical protein DB88DRAFT_498708 [Papiliotrema laurentii]